MKREPMGRKRFQKTLGGREKRDEFWLKWYYGGKYKFSKHVASQTDWQTEQIRYEILFAWMTID